MMWVIVLMKRVGIAHGAIRNAGDYPIYKRGFKLIRKVLGNNVEYVEIKRWKPFNENLRLDAIIILGGPIVSRRIHQQAKNIFRYIQTYQPEISVIAIGVGVSGENFKSITEYFLDSDSIRFWTRVGMNSGLLYVRDKVTKDILKEYGTKSYLTGCPALYSDGISPQITNIK